MLLQEIDVISEINCLKIQDLLLDVTIIGLFSVIYRAVIDLTEIEREVTHTIDQSLEDEGGVIKLLLTISGTIGRSWVPAPIGTIKLVSVTSPLSMPH
jgi:hypothetical protein